MPTPPWPTYPSSCNSRSSSTVGSWESSSSHGGSTPPPYYVVSAWTGPVPQKQIGPNAQGSVWDSNNYYEDILGRGMENINILEGDSSHPRTEGFEAKLQEDEPDLLDRLVMEDRMEKAEVMELKQLGAYNYQASSLEITNLLKLLQLQQSNNVAAPEGRAITRNQNVMRSNMNRNHRVALISNLSSDSVMTINHSPVAQKKKKSAVGLNLNASSVLPSKFKAPPPHHPPAVPHMVNNSIRSPTTPPATTRPGSVAVVQSRVQEAKWQFQKLEVERKKTEAALAKQNPGKRISFTNSVQISRLPLNPSQLDKLLVDSLREQARVLTLLQKLETINGKFITESSLNILAVWKQKIIMVTAIRRKERMDQQEKGKG